MTPNITSSRLNLRPLRKSDAQRVFECIQDPRIHRNVGRIPADQTIEQTELFISNSQSQFDDGTAFVFGVIEVGQNLIGVIGGSFTQYASFDFGYWLAPEAWGKGYATEASAAFMDWVVRKHGVKAFTAGHIDDNPASGRVLEKLGFIHAGRSRYFVLGRQEWCWSCDMAKIV